jgi:probable phosphoglycerate mutase
MPAHRARAGGTGDGIGFFLVSGDTRQPQGQIPLLVRPFVYLRHGETTSNRDAMIAGALDVELTTLGREQARQAGERLARLARHEGVAFAPIVSSRLQRAMETARIVAQAVDCTPESILHLPDLDERCWGALEGRPRSERRDDAWPPDIETADAFFSRVARGMAAIPMPEAGWLPVVAAHSGVWRVLCRLVGIQAAQAPIGNALPMRISPSPSGGWRVDSV